MPETPEMLDREQVMPELVAVPVVVALMQGILSAPVQALIGKTKASVVMAVQVVQAVTREVKVVPILTPAAR
jgi:hypothetical protein